jgi:hypothetical protein
MEAAKIIGLATYHRCTKELHTYGYISYLPSYNKFCNQQLAGLNDEYRCLILANCNGFSDPHQW